MSKMNPVNNKEKGRAGERRATAIIGVALCAQSIAASLEEEDKKVDIKFTYRNFIDGVLEDQHCQVKTGSSFAKIDRKKKIIKFKNISNDTKLALKTNSSILVWIPNKPSQNLYWAILDARKPGIPEPIKIQNHQSIRPSILIDFSRFKIYSRNSPGIIHHTVARGNNNLREKANSSFEELQARNFKNPLIGNIDISNYTWRHITRNSKTTKKRKRSLELLPLLDKYLEQSPNRFKILRPSFRSEGNKIHETRRIKLWFRKAITKGDNTFALVLKFKEEIIYPDGWLKYYLKREEISNNIVLENWWLVK